MLKSHCLHRRIVFILSIFILGSIGQFGIPQVQASIVPLCDKNTCTISKTFTNKMVNTNTTQFITSGIITMNGGALYPTTGTLNINMLGGATADVNHPGIILNGTQIINTQFSIGSKGGTSNQLQINGAGTHSFLIEHMVDIAGGILTIKPGSGITATFNIFGATYTDPKPFINIMDNKNPNTIKISESGHSIFNFKNGIKAIPYFIGFDNANAQANSKGEIDIYFATIKYDSNLTLNHDVIPLLSTNVTKNKSWNLSLKPKYNQNVLIEAKTDSTHGIINIENSILQIFSNEYSNSVSVSTLHNLGEGYALRIGKGGYLDQTTAAVAKLHLISDKGDGLIVEGNGKVVVTRLIYEGGDTYTIEAPQGTGLWVKNNGEVTNTTFHSYITAKHPIMVDGGTVALWLDGNTNLKGTQNPTDDVIQVNGGNVTLHYKVNANDLTGIPEGTYVHMTNGTVNMPSLGELVGREHALVVEGGTFTHDSINTPDKQKYTIFHGINGSGVRVTGGNAIFEDSSDFESDHGVGAEFLGGNITFKSSWFHEIGFSGAKGGLMVSGNKTTVTFESYTEDIDFSGHEMDSIGLDIKMGGHVTINGQNIDSMGVPGIIIKISGGGGISYTRSL